MKIKGQTQGTAPTENGRGEPCVHPDFILEAEDFELVFESGNE
ncbi:hypothetical protein ACFLY2_01950 [Patescibacteria group bacterium]